MTFDTTSKMKFKPISAVNICQKLVSPSPSRKKKFVIIANIKVLTNGTEIDARITARGSFFSFNPLEIKPATTPAAVVFTKHAMIVPGIEIFMKTDVPGKSKTTTPHIRPRKPPIAGPNIIAPIVIGINERLRLTPVGIIALIVCNTTSKAISNPVTTMV